MQIPYIPSSLSERQKRLNKIERLKSRIERYRTWLNCPDDWPDNGAHLEVWIRQDQIELNKIINDEN